MGWQHAQVGPVHGREARPAGLGWAGGCRLMAGADDRGWRQRSGRKRASGLRWG